MNDIMLPSHWTPPHRWELGGLCVGREAPRACGLGGSPRPASVRGWGGVDQDQSLGKDRRDIQADPAGCGHWRPVRMKRGRDTGRMKLCPYCTDGKGQGQEERSLFRSCSMIPLPNPLQGRQSLCQDLLLPLPRLLVPLEKPWPQPPR